jgi:AraC-like DNA-binding protein
MSESAYTSAVPEGQRFDFWRHLVSETFVPLEATREGTGSFHGELRGMSLGAMRLYQVDADSHVARRTSRLINSSSPEFFKLGLQLHGRSVLIQDGREAELRPGDFTVYDTTRPYTLAFSDAGRLLVLIFPRHLLGLSAEQLARITATRFAGQTGLSSLISSFLVQTAAILDEIDIRDNTRLATNVLDLLSTALAGCLDERPADVDRTHRALLLQIIAFIEQHLGDAGLTPADVAAAQHVSTRYLHKLFHAEGTTVSAWIRGRRLEQCSRDLRDPTLAHRSVSAIAARWGLPDAAHFSRLFRATFGMSPRDYRMSCGVIPSAEAHA